MNLWHHQLLLEIMVWDDRKFPQESLYSFSLSVSIVKYWFTETKQRKHIPERLLSLIRVDSRELTVVILLGVGYKCPSSYHNFLQSKQYSRKKSRGQCPTLYWITRGVRQGWPLCKEKSSYYRLSLWTKLNVFSLLWTMNCDWDLKGVLFWWISK